jgi:hypothetical protein
MKSRTDASRHGTAALSEIEQVHIASDADFMTASFSRLLKSCFSLGGRCILRERASRLRPRF